MVTGRRMLVIGAHSADFVWRAGGAIAVTTQAGGTARVIALSYGEKGESGELWKQPDQTIDNVKTIRHGEAERAAGHLGADFRCLDLGDYPLEIDAAGLTGIADEIREFAPDVLITHTDTDPFNPDHPVAYTAVGRARSLAAGAGVQSAFATVKPPEFFLFEPHQPELCNFMPTTFVDITAVMEAKVRGDERDEGPGLPADLLPRAGRPPRQPRPALIGQLRTSARPRRSSGSPRRWCAAL